MTNRITALDIIDVAILFLITLFAIIYAIPIIFIRRFHRHNNILTLNICIIIICCGLSWAYVRISFWLINQTADIRTLGTFSIIALYFTVQMPFSFVAANIHRCCSIVYYKIAFFKRKRWVTFCIGSQWLLAFILGLPNLIYLKTPTRDSLWIKLYSLVSLTMVPLLICFITNAHIYYFVRFSSHRVQSEISSSDQIQRRKISRRDLYLLRHMIFMFGIFVGSWGPVFVLPIIDHFNPVHHLLFEISDLWCEIGLFINMADLFLYNYKVRTYLMSICARCLIKP